MKYNKQQNDMEKQFNIELRSRVLEYSLSIESSINDLLLLNLGLYSDKRKTRLFSNRGKISFQNKIDLLNDIGALSKDENLDFQLLMNIRNKFMHDIECDSFCTLVYQLENGIVNRFKRFLEDIQKTTTEEDWTNACFRLFQKNIKTIKSKISASKDAINRKHKFLQIQNEQNIFYKDLIYDLLNEVSIVTESSELKNPKVAIL